MIIENENSFVAALSNGINLFTGAGFSLLAMDKQGRPLPTGSQLREELTTHFGLPGSLDLTQVATILSRSARDEFRSYLTARFTVGDYDSLYDVIDSIHIESIFTTNIDDLLYNVYSKSKNSYLNDLDLHGATFRDRRAVDLVTLHGCVLDSSREFSFTGTELASAFARDPDRWHFLTKSLQARPTLFWGYSLADSGTLESLHPSTVRERRLSDAWITVRPRTDEGTIRYFRALGFQIIEADTQELLTYISRQDLAVDTDRSGDGSTKETFPEWAIPDVGTVPVRSVIDFYRGAPPTWYDIYAGQLHQTRHHARIRDSLNAKKHTLVVGVPGSGKSTLLMQVMKDFPFRGHKLVCEAPTPAKAALILNRLAGSKALIGIDNFSDSLEGLLTLLQAPNIQVLACDRDYWFEIVSHRIPYDNLNVLDVTDLDGEDVQELIRRIPAEVRKADSSFPGTEDPSIFELIESNIVLPSLSKRYSAVLQQLSREDVRLLEFLLVSSYVHSCRTPVSMDMLLAYFHDTVAGYSEIHTMRDNLGRLVTDYLGDLDDGIQDYYSPRSTLVAEAVMTQAGRAQLKGVITKFHSNVSPYRIHRYDVFKRRAYDASLMQRVFDEWDEGRQFYRSAYERDKSPHVLQQGALFLAHKRRFQEAFQMIDEALVASKMRIPSIRNSHAVILFRANINRPETDGTVQRTLQESMEILRECYRYDKRKAYHAMVFADQALSYDDRYGRSESQGYLETAAAWLKDEQRRSPWHREVKRLHGLVSRRLVE